MNNKFSFKSIGIFLTLIILMLFLIIILFIPKAKKKDEYSNNKIINKNNEDLTDNKEETNKVTDYETGDMYWDYYVIETTTLPEVTYETVKYNENNEYFLYANVANTILEFTPQEFIDKLKKAPFLQDQEYIFIINNIEECKFTNVTNYGIQKKIYVSDIIYVFPKSEADKILSSDESLNTSNYYMKFCFKRNVSLYNNYNNIEIDINDIVINRDKQKELHSFFEYLFGLEFANNFVYAQDRDNQNIYNKKLEKRDLGEIVRKNNTGYNFTRIINIDENSESNHIFFGVDIFHDDEYIYNYAYESYYCDNYNCIMNSPLFSLDNYILGNFGSLDTTNSSFGSEYMKYGWEDIYDKTALVEYTYKKTNLLNGNIKETFDLKVEKESYYVKENPTLNITMYFITENNNIIDFIISFKGDIGLSDNHNNENNDYSNLYNPFIEKIKTIIGDNENITSIELKSFLEEKTISFEKYYLEKLCNVNIYINKGYTLLDSLIGTFEIEISLKK